jgi:hypothetical protein
LKSAELVCDQAAQESVSIVEAVADERVGKALEGVAVQEAMDESNTAKLVIAASADEADKGVHIKVMVKDGTNVANRPGR